MVIKQGDDAQGRFDKVYKRRRKEIVNKDLSPQQKEESETSGDDTKRRRLEDQEDEIVSEAKVVSKGKKGNKKVKKIDDSERCRLEDQGGVDSESFVKENLKDDVDSGKDDVDLGKISDLAPVKAEEETDKVGAGDEIDVGEVTKEKGVNEKRGGGGKQKKVVVIYDETELRRSVRERKPVMKTGFQEELDEFFPEDDCSRKRRKKNVSNKDGEETSKTRTSTRSTKGKGLQGPVSYAEKKKRPLTDENVLLCVLYFKALLQ